MLTKELLTKLPKTSRTFLYYYGKIKYHLREYQWDRFLIPKATYVVKFKTQSITYDWDAVQLVKKMYKRLGWEIECTQYHLQYDDGPIKAPTHYYIWKLTNVPPLIKHTSHFR